MAETPKSNTPPQVTAADLAKQLKQKANDWVEKFSGKPNYNPHVTIHKVIDPLVKQLEAKDAIVTPQLLATIAAIPAEPPVIDTNWAPEVKQGGFRPQATPESVGDKNAR